MPTDASLAAGDVLTIRFPNRLNQDRDMVVMADGSISLPFVGSEKVVGRTLDDIQKRVTRLYDSLSYTPAIAADSTAEYVISVGDELEVRFRDATQLNTSLPVRPDGRITLPLVKSVVAEGKTPEALERELIRLYAQFLRTADLVVIVQKYTNDRVRSNGRMSRAAPRDLDGALVTVTAYAPRSVYVAGEVKTPGFVAYREPLTALQSIIASGGTVRTSRLDKVLVLRNTGVEKPVAIVLDLKAYVTGKSASDIRLRPFDIVIVPRTKIGQVNDALDQYLYQLIPATRNINFSYFYEIGGRKP